MIPSHVIPGKDKARFLVSFLQVRLSNHPCTHNVGILVVHTPHSRFRNIQILKSANFIIKADNLYKKHTQTILYLVHTRCRIGRCCHDLTLLTLGKLRRTTRRLLLVVILLICQEIADHFARTFNERCNFAVVVASSRKRSNLTFFIFAQCFFSFHFAYKYQ